MSTSQLIPRKGSGHTARKALLCFEHVGPFAILALAALLRLWALGRPGSLVFDELYYVRDAVSQLAHGVPTTWPDDDPAFGGERARAFSDDPSSIAHPPLGKWLIGLGLLLLGPDTGWGWRLSVALAGVAAVGVTMRIGFVLSRSLWVACLAGLLLAVDGVHIVLSRVALLDGLLTLFVALGALFVLHDQLSIRTRLTGNGAGSAARIPLQWRRPWLLFAGLAFGAAAAIKWSGLYPLAAFLVLVTVGDLLRRFRGEDRHPLGRALAQALVTALIALIAAIIAYLASWAGWIANRLGGLSGLGADADDPWWAALWKWHAHSLSWHSSLVTEHPYQAHPLTWPLALRPTAMFRESTEGYVALVSPLPNPLVTWGGVAALLLLAWVLVRGVWIAGRLRTLEPLGSGAIAVCAFVLTGYLSGWLPWVLTFSRSAVFQFYSVVLTPFAALALALVLTALASLPGTGALFARAGIALDESADAVQGRRITVAIFVIAALVLGVLFWPLWSAMPVADWFYRVHLWLPGW